MRKKTRVAVDIRDLRIAKTGARTYLEELLREFRKMQDPELEFIFYDTLFPVYTGNNKLLKIVEHIRFSFWKQLQLPFSVRADKCDVLFCTDYFAPYFHPGFKTYTVFHDAFFFEYPAHYNKLWLKLFKLFGLSAAKRAEAVITPTHYTKQQLIKLSGIPENLIKVIYEGPKTLPKATKNPDFFSNAKYLLHVGTMEKRKNILNLLIAFKMLLNNDADLKLVLIGQFSTKTPNDDKQQILSKIKELQIEDNVILKGYVNDRELADWYANARAYVFPSVNEGFGIPILESFHQDVPVLVADNSCMPEVGGDAVVSFNPYDPAEMAQKIAEVLYNDALRGDLIQKGRERLKLFSWKTAAEELVSLFKQYS